MESNIDPAEDTRWNKIEEKTNRSTVGPENSVTDWGKEYIEQMHAEMDKILSKPRRGTDVSNFVLCSRLRVFREIDPLPITAKALNMFITGIANHNVAQWLFLHDTRRFEREKHLKYWGITGSVDIYDKIRNIPQEFKTTRAFDILEPKPWHIQQLKYYMAMLGASQGYVLYQRLMHFGDRPFKAFKITMNEQERKEQLDKLVEEADSLKMALEFRDPSLIRGSYIKLALQRLSISSKQQENPDRRGCSLIF
jgi:hypothetical protein